MSKKDHNKKRSRGQYITIGIIAAVAIVIGVSAVAFIQNPPETAKFGAVGSTHIHATMLVMVHGQEIINFSMPNYQMKSPYIHFENRNGHIVHMHATNVHIGYLFKTLNMEFNDKCLRIDNGTSYCNDENNTLKFYVNGVKNNKYGEYIFKDGDKILISYGKEDPIQIENELRMLDKISSPST